MEKIICFLFEEERDLTDQWLLDAMFWKAGSFASSAVVSGKHHLFWKGAAGAEQT